MSRIGMFCAIQGYYGEGPSSRLMRRPELRQTPRFAIEVTSVDKGTAIGIIHADQALEKAKKGTKRDIKEPKGSWE